MKIMRPSTLADVMIITNRIFAVYKWPDSQPFMQKPAIGLLNIELTGLLVFGQSLAFHQPFSEELLSILMRYDQLSPKISWPKARIVMSVTNAR